MCGRPAFTASAAPRCVSRPSAVLLEFHPDMYASDKIHDVDDVAHHFFASDEPGFARSCRLMLQ